MNELLLGNEALALGAKDAGVKIASAYPGTPSTEITEALSQYKEIHSEWAANEKVALEVVMGASVVGARALCSMKHVGVNVAADPLFTAAYTGVNGGVVLVCADDPGMHSSQNEQDSRYYALAAHLPMLEPSDGQECYDFIKEAYEISEQLDLPVMLRTTTRIAHTRTIVKTSETKDIEIKEYEKNIAKYVMMPGNARIQRVRLLERMKKAEEYAENSKLNKIEKRGDKIGVITSGGCYQYVREALPEASILKLGMIHPLPFQMIEEFSKSVDTLYVVEELESIFETQIKARGIEIIGREIFPAYGEYSVEIIKNAIANETSNLREVETDLPVRPPVLCPGCPHRSVYYVLKRMRLTAFGDIGCYTLGASWPLEALDTTLCMGASIGMAHGAQLVDAEFSKKSVAVIGDSTFFHSGLTGLASMTYNKGNGTILILDNRTTGMTGHQDNPATGMTLQGEEVKPIDIEETCKALGAQHVRTVDALQPKELQKAIRESLEEEGVSVVVARHACVLIEKQKQTEALVVNERRCTNCGICLRTGCPALEKGMRATTIDASLCTGCGLCASICPQKCIGGQDGGH